MDGLMEVEMEICGSLNDRMPPSRFGATVSFNVYNAKVPFSLRSCQRTF